MVLISDYTKYNWNASQVAIIKLPIQHHRSTHTCIWLVKKDYYHIFANIRVGFYQFEKADFARNSFVKEIDTMCAEINEPHIGSDD